MKKARYIRQSTKNQTNLRQLAKSHPDEELFIDFNTTVSKQWSARMMIILLNEKIEVNGSLSVTFGHVQSDISAIFREWSGKSIMDLGHYCYSSPYNYNIRGGSM